MNDYSSYGAYWIIYLAVMILLIVSLWKVYVKAGKPGWGCIIPFYNIYLLVEIAGKPGWWMLLYFIPIVNLVVAIIVSIEVARKFGQGTGFGIGLFLLSFIFYPILAFGKAKYKKS